MIDALEYGTLIITNRLLLYAPSMYVPVNFMPLIYCTADLNIWTHTESELPHDFQSFIIFCT